MAFLSRTGSRIPQSQVNVEARFKNDARTGSFYDLSEEQLAFRFEQAACTPLPYPSDSKGRGIVIPGGGARYLINAWVCVRILRRMNCQLPIEIWHIGESEAPISLRELFQDYGVSFRDAEALSTSHFHRKLNGWTLKAYALAYCSFEEVLLLDADNVPLRNPEFLFDDLRFQMVGAIFWPDYTRLRPSNPIWKILNIPFRNEREFESGQILIQKQAIWPSLALATWLANFPELLFQYVLGDKELFHLALLKTGQQYLMPERDAQPLAFKAMLQHDLDGFPLFQHRNGAKWRLFGFNESIAGFKFEDECCRYLADLAQRTEVIDQLRPKGLKLLPEAIAWAPPESVLFSKAGSFSVRVALNANGVVWAEQANDILVFFEYADLGNQTVLRFYNWDSVECTLTFCPENNRWEGSHHDKEQTPCLAYVGDFNPLGNRDNTTPLRSRTDSPVEFKWLLKTRDERVSLFNLLDGGAVVGLGHLGIGFWTGNIDDGLFVLRLEFPFGELRIFTITNANAWTPCHKNEFQVLPTKMPSIAPDGVDPMLDRCMWTYRPSQRAFELPAYSKWSSALRETPRFHRLQWEFVTVLASLQKAGCVAPGKHGLCLFSRVEPVTAYLASQGCRITINHENPNVLSEELAHMANAPEELLIRLNERGLCPALTFSELVQVSSAATKEVETHYDFVYGIGLLPKTTELASISKWLKDQRINCPVFLTGDLQTPGLDSNEEHLSLILKHFEKAGLELQTDVHANVTVAPLDEYIDMPPYSSDVHYRFMRQDGTAITSGILEFRLMETT